MKRFTLTALATLLIGVFTTQAQFHESFDVTGTPAGWSVINYGGSSTWKLGPYYMTNSGPGLANLGTDNPDNLAHDDYLVTPAINVTAGVNDQFRFFTMGNGDASFDKFSLVLSTNGNGGPFTVFLLQDVSPQLPNFEEHVVNLSAYIGQTVHIAFHSTATYGEQAGIKIDDVFSEGLPTCDFPTNLSVSNQTSTSADLSWTETGGATEWEVIYGLSGFSPIGGGTTETVTGGTPELSLTGLTADETYDFYVRSVCSPGFESNLSPAKSFTTGYCEFKVTTGSGFYFVNLFKTQNATTNIDNTTSSSTGYIDKSAISVASSVDESFNITIGLSNGLYAPKGVNVWIDWNNDFVFDASEKVFSNPSVSGQTNQITGTITVPAGTALGDYRIRIVVKEGDTDPAACGSTTYAGAIDYTLTVLPQASCSPVSNLTTVGVTSTTAELTWDAGQSETEWKIVYGPTGFDPLTQGTIETVQGPTPAITLTGLTSNTTYDFYVTAVCGTGDESIQFGTGHFTTDCAIVGIPYTLDFEPPYVSELPICTSIESVGSGNDWKTESVNQNGFTTYVLSFEASYITADSWFYTQGIELEAGVSYKIDYDYGNDDANKSHKMKVAYGTSPSASAMTNPIVEYLTINSGTLSSESIIFTAQADGDYYFGFNALTNQYQGSMFLDNINIDLAPTCFAVDNITVSDIQKQQATITWTSEASATNGYEITVYEEGADPSTAIAVATDLTVSDIQNEQATITWTSTASATGGYEINVYEAGADPLTDPAVKTETVTAGVNNVTITGLTGKTTYDVYVTSNCELGVTEMSASETFTTDNLGVAENALTQVNYFPNPVNGQLNISAESTIETVTVYNLTGKAVMEVKANNSSLSIDMSSLSNGTYFVKAKIADTVSTFKVVKQ